ncbi:MAG: sigma-70 family RNA polymerase sigma factor [Acidobacteria bacterium]|nr:sigma-70 family RNA polymerase sigma factor [Acidobacteriota bacterium]
MNETRNEERLIEACKQGDREAFRQLFELHKDRVWSVALHFIGDETIARDITQQVFLKLFTAINQFRGEAGFSTWLYRMVANVCMDEQRRRRRFLSFDFFRTGNDTNAMDEPRIKQLEQAPPQEDSSAQLQLSAAVKSAVKELKPKLRIAILLKYFEGLSYEEMAVALGCSTGTVASRLNRGHKELARKLAHLKQ